MGSDILHYQQGIWMYVETAGTPLYGLVMLSAKEGWAVGGQGEIMHYTGGDWRQVPAIVGTDLTGVTFASPEEGWAVGQAGVVLHYHAGAWSNVSPTSSKVSFTAVALVSPSEGWAVGMISTGSGLTGAIYHFTQGRWVQVNSPTHSAWNALAMVSAQNGWTGGTQGTLLEYADGKWC